MAAIPQKSFVEMTAIFDICTVHINHSKCLDMNSKVKLNRNEKKWVYLLCADNL